VLAVAAAGGELLRQLEQSLRDLLRLRVALASTLERLGGIRTGNLGGVLLDLGRRGRGHLITALVLAVATARLHGVAAATSTLLHLANTEVVLAGVVAAATGNSGAKIGRGEGAHFVYT